MASTFLVHVATVLNVLGDGKPHGYKPGLASSLVIIVMVCMAQCNNDNTLKYQEFISFMQGFYG